MSDLQIRLIGLAVLLIVGLFLHGWWQDRRARKQIKMPKTAIDPLEPTVPKTKEEVPTKAEIQRRKPRATVKEEPKVEPLLGQQIVFEVETAENDELEPDPACEAVIDLFFDEAIKGEEISPFTMGIKHTGTKKIWIYAKTVAGNHHASFRPQEKYNSLHFSVLLANRTGPIRAEEWNEVNSRVRVLAEQFGGRIETVDYSKIVQHAQQLDEVCAALDAQIGLSLVAQGKVWEPADIIHAALELGAVGPQNGRLEWVDSDGRARFFLCRPGNVSIESLTANGIPLIHFVLDVPRSHHEKGMFARMAVIAKKLAYKLSADIVDDSGKPLRDGEEKNIDLMLEECIEKLDQHYLTAGSLRALKVFS